MISIIHEHTSLKYWYIGVQASKQQIISNYFKFHDIVTCLGMTCRTGKCFVQKLFATGEQVSYNHIYGYRLPVSQIYLDINDEYLKR